MVRPLICLASICVITLWTGPVVWAQEETKPPQVDPYIALFGGIAMPFKSDVKVDSNGLNQHYTVLDQTFSDSRTIGGKVGAWFPGLRRSTALDLGLELDVTNFQPDVKAGRFRASGTANGAIQPANLDVTSNIVAINFLLRLPLYVSEDFPHGRLYPYAGGGPGLQKSNFGSNGRTNNELALQAVGGVHVFLAKRVSLFAEYKYTHASQTFGFTTSTGGTQDEKYTFNVSHAVAGLAVHFGP